MNYDSYYIVHLILFYVLVFRFIARVGTVLAVILIQTRIPAEHCKLCG